MEFLKRLEEMITQNRENRNETIDSTSESIKARPNTEENIKKIRKICRRKILNTKEELEMRKGGLISAFNIPINERRGLSKGKSYRKNLIKLSKINHHRIIKKNFNKLKSQLNILTIEEYQTISFISLIRKIPVKYLVNSPDIKGKRMV